MLTTKQLHIIQKSFSNIIDNFPSIMQVQSFIYTKVINNMNCHDKTTAIN